MEESLPERQRLVLKEIVDRYIRHREPVSSRMILEDYGLSVSSATVRNDMNDLEAAGYIEKPYASSGRVPTAKGYRFFVDWLLDLSELTKKDRKEVMEAYEVHCVEIGETMWQTAFLLGSITGDAGFVIPPRLEETRLDRVMLLRMAPRLILFVVISDIGVVEHRLVPLEEELTAEDVDRVTEIINSTLRGVPLSTIRKLTLEEAPEEWYDRPVRQALLLLERILEERRSPQKLYFEGLLNLVDGLRAIAPERALDDFVGLIHAVQDERGFVEAIRRARGEREGIVVSIGDLPLPGLERYSIVSLDYRPHAGVLGVIGPEWMDYGRVLSAASYVKNRLESLLVASCARCPNT